MIVKKIDVDKKISKNDIDIFLKKSEQLQNPIAWSSLDVGLDTPIIALDLGVDYERLVMANPKVLEASNDRVVYYEMDSEKRKVRKTARAKSMTIETSNLGKITFETSKTDWGSFDELMSDEELLECVMAQRLIDAINGIDVTSPLRRYNEQITKDEEIPRNKKIMLQSKKGDTVFVKFKHAQKFLDKGYEII